MKKKLCIAMLMTSACLVACGNKEEAKETVKATVAVETEQVQQTEQTEAEQVQQTEQAEQAEQAEQEEAKLPEITGEFSSLNVNGTPIVFGKSTIEELDDTFDDGAISEAEAFAAMFGMPNAINSDKLGYKFHFYDMAMLALGIELEDGVTPVIGFMVDNKTFKLDDEIRKLTADELSAKFGEYTTDEDGNFIWDTEEMNLTALYEDGEISTFIILNKDMVEFMAPYLKDKIDNYTEDVPEEVIVESKNNLTGDFTTEFTIGDISINLGDVITEEDDTSEYLYETFSGRSSSSIYENYIWTFSDWGDGNSLTIGGVGTGEEIKDAYGDDLDSIIVKSVGMEFSDPETIEVEQFKGLSVDKLKAELGTPYNDGTDLVWENDKIEVRAGVSENRVTSIKVSDFQFAQEDLEMSFSLDDIDISGAIDMSLVESLKDKDTSEYAGELIKLFKEM